MLEQIDEAYCLVYDKRYSDWERLENDFLSIGLKVKPFISGNGHILPTSRYDRIDITGDFPKTQRCPTINCHNAFLSHRVVLERFLANKKNKTLLLTEDDAIVEEDFTEVIESVTPFFEGRKWDMIYLGAYYTAGSYERTDHPNVLKLSKGGGFHGVIMRRFVAEKLLEVPAAPMDHGAGLLHNCINAYAIHPQIVSQARNFSFVEQRYHTNDTRKDRFYLP